jgi:hypothetical protein
LKEINIPLEKHEKIRIMEADRDGNLVFLTTTNSLILTRFK